MAPREHVLVLPRGALHAGDPVEDVVIVDRLVEDGHGRVLRLGRRGGGGRGLREGAEVEDGVGGGGARGLGRRAGGRCPEEVVVRGGGRGGGSGAGPGGSRGRGGAGSRHGRGLALGAEAEVAGQEAREVVHGGRGGRRIGGSGPRAPRSRRPCPLAIG